MFAHHHVQRERLSVRQRMSDVLSALRTQSFVEFAQLFRAEEGRMGVAVTFSAILELLREGVEVVQRSPCPRCIAQRDGKSYTHVVGAPGPDRGISGPGGRLNP
jgi:segregation and condensation protein A